MATRALKSIVQSRKDRRPRTLDISGKRGGAYRKRKLSLISRARLEHGERKPESFQQKRRRALRDKGRER